MRGNPCFLDAHEQSLLRLVVAAWSWPAAAGGIACPLALPRLKAFCAGLPPCRSLQPTMGLTLYLLASGHKVERLCYKLLTGEG
jgi:hypothetical protein